MRAAALRHFQRISQAHMVQCRNIETSQKLWVEQVRSFGESGSIPFMVAKNIIIKRRIFFFFFFFFSLE